MACGSYTCPYKVQGFKHAGAGSFTPYFHTFCFPPWLLSCTQLGQVPTITSHSPGHGHLSNIVSLAGGARGARPLVNREGPNQWCIPGPEKLLDHAFIWSQLRSDQAINGAPPPLGGDHYLWVVFLEQWDWLEPLPLNQGHCVKRLPRTQCPRFLFS